MKSNNTNIWTTVSHSARIKMESILDTSGPHRTKSPECCSNFYFISSPFNEKITKLMCVIHNTIHTDTSNAINIKFQAKNLCINGFSQGR